MSNNKFTCVIKEEGSINYYDYSGEDITPDISKYIGQVELDFFGTGLDWLASGDTNLNLSLISKVLCGNAGEDGVSSVVANDDDRLSYHNIKCHLERSRIGLLQYAIVA